MVQIIENWAELAGTVRSITDSDKGPDHRTVLVDLERITDVEGYPNLVDAHPGDTVAVIIRDDVLDRSAVTEGSRVHGRVRKATPFEIFAHPDGLVVEDDRTTWCGGRGVVGIDQRGDDGAEVRDIVDE